MNIKEILQFLIDNEGSDIHIIPGSPCPSGSMDILSFPAGPQLLGPDQTEPWIFDLLSEEQKS
jgi:Tfp pilus assembly pilus retraction ATPase PilT